MAVGLNADRPQNYNQTSHAPNYFKTQFDERWKQNNVDLDLRIWITASSKEQSVNLRILAFEERHSAKNNQLIPILDSEYGKNPHSGTVAKQVQ